MNDVVYNNLKEKERVVLRLVIYGIRYMCVRLIRIFYC
jgi:hypothetical protein